MGVEDRSGHRKVRPIYFTQVSTGMKGTDYEMPPLLLIPGSHVSVHTIPSSPLRASGVPFMRKSLAPSHLLTLKVTELRALMPPFHPFIPKGWGGGGG